jgi:cytidylate kinase
MVGRDIGTVVLPTAECKLFLDASPEERARRRYLEIAQHAREFGSNILTLEEILQDIMRRDELDRANMKPADDAIFIVTDHYDALQLLEYVYGLLQSLPARDRVPSKAGTKM